MKKCRRIILMLLLVTIFLNVTSCKEKPDEVKNVEQPTEQAPIVISVDNEYIIWKYADDLTWQKLVSLTSLKGPQGEVGLNGKEIVLRRNEDSIEWQYKGDTTWTEIASLAELVAPKTELSLIDGYIKWRYAGEESWNNLIAVDGLKGEIGLTPQFKINEDTLYWEVSYDEGTTWTSLDVKAQGEKGETGTPKEIVLRKTETSIEWQYIGDQEWTKIIDISELKAPKTEIAIIDGYIKWRYDNETEWKELIELEDLKVKGEDGATPTFRINSETLYWEVSYDEGTTWTSLNIKAQTEGTTGNVIKTIQSQYDAVNKCTKITISYTDSTKSDDVFTIKDGLSAYELYVKYHPEYTKTEAEWVEEFYGNDAGTAGLSAYELYVKYHPEYTKTEAEWVEEFYGNKNPDGLTHTITFVTKTGNTTYQVEHGKTATIPFPIEGAYCPPGHDIFDDYAIGFDKWLDQDGNEFTAATPVTKDLYLRAVYKEVPIFDVYIQVECFLFNLKRYIYGQSVNYSELLAEELIAPVKGLEFICFEDVDTHEKYYDGTPIKGECTLAPVYSRDTETYNYIDYWYQDKIYKTVAYEKDENVWCPFDDVLGVEILYWVDETGEYFTFGYYISESINLYCVTEALY